MAGNAFEYWTVTMFSADLEDGYSRFTDVNSNRAGSLATASDPRPLLTFTMTGALLAASSGRNAG